MNFQTIQDRFGKHYKVVVSNGYGAVIRKKSVKFDDVQSTLRFLDNVLTPHDFWLRVLHNTGGPGVYSGNTLSIKYQLSNLLMLEKIRVFEITLVKNISGKQKKPEIKTGLGKKIVLSDPLSDEASQSNKIKFVSNEKDASSIVENLQVTDTEVSELCGSLGLNVNGVGCEGITAKEILSKAISEGDVVLLEKNDMAPTSEKTIIEEVVSTIAGNRDSSLGPEKVEEICGTCTVNSFNVSCGHGRSAGSKGVLQIVPSANKSTTQAYSILNVKVAAKKEFGGTEKISSKLSLNGNKFSHCIIIDDRIASPGETSSEKKLYSSNVASDDLWTRSTKPKIYNVYGRSCTDSKKVSVELFPNEQYSIEGNLDVFAKWAKQINKSWEDWGATFFKASPVQLSPKITLPTGSFSAAWGWKEDSDWRAYYGFACSFGLNPVLGVSIEAKVSMVSVGLTAVGIPPVISRFAADHIFDLFLRVKAGCQAVLQGSPSGKFYTDGETKLSGSLKSSVSGSISLGGGVKAGSEYIIALELSFDVEAKVTDETETELNSDGLFVQRKINLAPLTGIVTVKKTYFTISGNEKTDTWTPFPKPLVLFEGDREKIFPSE